MSLYRFVHMTLIGFDIDQRLVRIASLHWSHYAAAGGRKESEFHFILDNRLFSNGLTNPVLNRIQKNYSLSRKRTLSSDTNLIQCFKHQMILIHLQSTRTLARTVLAFARHSVGCSRKKCRDGPRKGEDGRTFFLSM